MATRIHYGDNIYYIETFLKTIKNGLALEIDADYFCEKMLEDLLFIGSAMGRIYNSLKANTHLIKKADYSRSLLRAKRDFIALVDDILAKKLPLASELSSGFPKLKICRAEEARDVEEIRAFIETREQVDLAAESDLISREEFHFLLTSADDTDSKN